MADRAATLGRLPRSSEAVVWWLPLAWAVELRGNDRSPVSCQAPKPWDFPSPYAQGIKASELKTTRCGAVLTSREVHVYLTSYNLLV